MMADLIDRQAALEEIASLQITINGLREGKTILQEALTAYRKAVLAEIEAVPTVDAVEVVRCKKCIHAQWSKKNKAYYCNRRWALHKVRERDYCSYGARRKDDG